MDDPWDVKSVRQSGQYTSCMKINGVPLLPPLLSKECRTEMQYYKLLAKEVEKRISALQPFVDSDTDSAEDRTFATETLECEDIQLDDTVKVDRDINNEKVLAEKSLDETLTNPILHPELYTVSNDVDDTAPSKFILDFSVDINEAVGKIAKDVKVDSPTSPLELPERDYNGVRNLELLTDVESKNVQCKKKKDTIVEEIVNFSITLARDKSIDSSRGSFSREGPPSLSCKSFTGSLNDIHMQSEKGVNVDSKLVRQSSYTILNPSPQLLAHLEVQSLNLGVDMSTISMSESMSSLTPSKKRRSWDLELAKVKWSNMAMELKDKKLNKSNIKNNRNKGQTIKRTSPTRAKSVAAARTKYASLSVKPNPKTEPIVKTRTHSPMRDTPSDRTIILEEPISLRSTRDPKTVKSVKEPTTPNTLNHKNMTQENLKATSNKKEPQSNKLTTPNPEKTSDKRASPTKPQLVSDSEDPAVKVRELYDNIQKQQLLQMASLVEKQKREQMLLQQAFEEQNNLLFKQLKTICPESPEDVKEAWVDKTDTDRGPVSLSQLINSKSPETFDSPVSTLTNSNKYINHCDSVLKRSRDISSTIKKDNSLNQNGKAPTSKAQSEGRRRANSPIRKSTPTSRRLNYDTSVSSERDYEPILTDRTNDTMADLNVTFPSDSEDCRPSNDINLCYRDVTVIQNSTPAQLTDCAIKCMEQTIHNSISGSRAPRNRTLVNQPTPKQQAAASRIVAYAKGYLVRRLMRTARVQSTVQTIKDALLCALQLHQDRQGIRGADVDLHRRLIQQITAACYSLHDTFITSTAGERCAMIAADRSRRASLASRASPKYHHTDVMSKSHSGVFPPRPRRVSGACASLMTQSNYEKHSSDGGRARYMPSPRRRPWR